MIFTFFVMQNHHFPTTRFADDAKVLGQMLFANIFSTLKLNEKEIKF